jgi:hypothetical protein
MVKGLKKVIREIITRGVTPSLVHMSVAPPLLCGPRVRGSFPNPTTERAAR